MSAGYFDIDSLSNIPQAELANLRASLILTCLVHIMDPASNSGRFLKACNAFCKTYNEEYTLMENKTLGRVQILFYGYTDNIQLPLHRGEEIFMDYYCSVKARDPLIV